MDRITFRNIPHQNRSGVEVCEILLNGQMVATIYPDQINPKSIKIVSAHFAGKLTRDNQFPEGVKMSTGEGIFPPIPTVYMHFNPRRYSITPEGIERQE